MKRPPVPSRTPAHSPAPSRTRAAACTLPSPRTLAAAVAFALAGAAAPAGISAQACLGSAALRGEFPVGLVAAITNSSTEYRAEAGANLEGPLAFRSSIGLLDRDGSDEYGIVGSGTGLWETGSGALSACAITGFRHATWSFEPSGSGMTFDASELSFPVGFGVGTHLGSGRAVRFAPALGAGLLISRFSSNVSSSGPGAPLNPSEQRERDTEAAFYLSASAGASLGRALLRAEWAYTTRDRFDPTLSVHLGIRLWSDESTRQIRN